MGSSPSTFISYSRNKQPDPESLARSRNHNGANTHSRICAQLRRCIVAMMRWHIAVLCAVPERSRQRPVVRRPGQSHGRRIFAHRDIASSHVCTGAQVHHPTAGCAAYCIRAIFNIEGQGAQFRRAPRHRRIDEQVRGCIGALMRRRTCATAYLCTGALVHARDA